MTTITVYKIQSPESKKIYIGLTTLSFHRLVITMKSRFRQYVNLLEIKTPTTEEQDKIKLYYNVCFELFLDSNYLNLPANLITDYQIEKRMTQLARYECSPTENIFVIKRALTRKFTVEINPEILIKQPCMFKIKDFKINDRKSRDTRYKEKHRETINNKQKEKNVCQVCQGWYATANKKKHLATKKHQDCLLSF